MIDYQWIRPDMDLYHIGKNDKCIITITNSGNLEVDFYEYAKNFYEAAEIVICYLLEEASKNHDIAKLDLWYFAMVYLYRQSLELLLKACIFQVITGTVARKDIVKEIRHNLKQSFEKLIEKKRLSIDENENAKWVIDYLADITQVDEKSDMFRYPFGNNFKAFFKKDTHISLIATHDNMNKAYAVIKNIYDVGDFPTRTYKAYSPNLIIEGGDYYQKSVVGYKYSEYSFYPYFSSYLEVGNFLRDIIIEQKKTNLFMPMCYLYRNVVELGLKKVIVEDSHLDYLKAIKITQNKKHSILGLWNSAEDEIRKYAFDPKYSAKLKDVQRYIMAFHTLDLNSDLFRYPCDKNMKIYFIRAKKFDIKNIASCFEELCNFLVYVDQQLDENKEPE